MLIGMELRHLRYFCAVAEDMNVTRAAERLRLAQPSLTQQIKALEEELETPLLRRVGRGIELTQAGAVFWEKAKAILDEVHSATLITQETARGLAGRLAIGLTETASFSPQVTAVLKRARALWPKAKFGLIQARSGDLFAALIERQIDVAFARTPMPEHASLEWRPFLTEGLFVAMPNLHPLALKRSVQSVDLIDEDLIMTKARTPHGGLRGDMSAEFTAFGRAPRILQEAPGYVAAVNLVAAGFGLTIVPAALVGLCPTAVTYRPFHTKSTRKSQILIVMRKGEISPIATNFVALATETALHLKAPRKAPRPKSI
jgi:DNA-binding transcriptional LysR family regulator